MYIPKVIFPSVVDASSLPGPFCSNANLDVNGTCPFQGYGELLQNLNFTNFADNITIDSPLNRIMSTRPMAYGTGLAWTIIHLLANYMSLGLHDSDSETDNSSEVEVSVERNAAKASLVEVYCERQNATDYK